MRLSIVDLGLGNLHSVRSAVERVGGAAEIITTAAAIGRAERLLVPGQGAFRDGALAVAGEVGEALVAKIAEGTPYLGICLGIQLLFEGSDESPGSSGLGVFAGRCVRFPEQSDLKVPHMGWNTTASSSPLVEEGAYYYYVHSYHCVPTQPEIIAARSHYGQSFCAAVSSGSVFACQFHPEKSQRRGETLLRRFLTWNPALQGAGSGKVIRAEGVEEREGRGR